jgi:hypothetical protein
VRNRGSALDPVRPSHQRRLGLGDPSVASTVPHLRTRPLPVETPERHSPARLEPPQLQPQPWSGPWDAEGPPAACPLLRIHAAAALAAGGEAPHARNRCTALDAQLPVGTAQQELVCLSGSYAACPSYRRALATVVRRDAARGRVSGLSVRLGAAVLGVVLASAAGHALARGTDPQQPTDGRVQRADAALSGAAAIPAGITQTDASVLATTQLQPCAGRADCFEWVVGPGDTVASIAAALGRPIPSVLALNPEILGPGDIRAGDRVRVPPPGY